MDTISNPARAALDRIVDDLHGRGRLRVWSIIVSVFGDLAHPRECEISAVALQELMDRFRIQSGAVRTAISRLVEDRWIERRRQGRSASYRLTPAAARETDEAAARIYAAKETCAAGPVHLVVLPSGSAAEDARAAATSGLVRLRRNVHIWPGADPAVADLPAGAFLLSGEVAVVPDWVTAEAAPAAIAAGFDEVCRLFEPLLRAIGAAPLCGADAVAARALLIHYWRRALLRHPAIPTALCPSGWPEPACRAMVGALYSKLSSQVGHWLQENVPGTEPDPARFDASRE